MDTSGSSEDLETSIESLGSSILGRSIHEDDRHRRESSVTLRSHCSKGTCALGLGLQFRSRISPSPSKQKLRSTRRRRRSDQSRLDASDLDQSHSHHHHHGDHHHHHHYQHHHHSHHQQEGPAPQPVLLVSSDEDEVENIHREGAVFRTPQRITKESVSSTPETRSVQSLSETTLPNGYSPPSPIGVNIGPPGEITDITDLSVSPVKDPTLPAIVESSESGFEEGNVAGETVVTSSPLAEVFICARRFFTDAHSRSKLISITSDYFGGAETPSKAKVRDSTRRLSIRKEQNSFIAYSSDEELDEWMKKPKTNYTYSESLTYRERVTPDRHIDSPNMSRRTLRGLDPGQASSREFSYIPFDAGDSRLNLRSRDVPRTMDALSDGSDTEEYEGIARRRSSRSRSIDSYSNRNGSAFTRTFAQSTKTTTKTISYGLDVESDVDDGTETPLPHRAVPFIARGSTPLTRGTPPPQTTKLTKGYTLSKGLVTLNEDEEDANSSSIIIWTRKTKKTVTRVVTYIFSTLLLGTIQAAASATAAITKSTVDTSSASSAVSSSEATSLSGAASSAEATSTIDEASSLASDSSSSSSYFTKTCTCITTTTHTIWSYITGSASYVTTSTSKGFHSYREKVKARPLWFWIPLLLILLLLALTAYWWLLQSSGKTEDSNDSTDEEFSFFSSLLIPLNGIASYLMFGLWHIWNSALFLAYCIGDFLHNCLSAILVYLYNFNDAAQNALSYSLTAVNYFFHTIWLFIVDKSLAGISIFKDMYGFLMSSTSEDSHEELSDSHESWSLFGWWSDSSPTAWVMNAYTLTKESASSSWASFLSGFIWLVTQIGEGLTWTVDFLWWCLSTFLSTLLAALHWLKESVLLLLFYLGSSTSSVMYTTGAVIANTTKSSVEGIKMVISYLPFFGSSHSSIVKSGHKSESIESIVKDPQPAVTAPEHKVDGLAFEEIIAKVVKSKDLHLMIASAIAENNHKGDHEQLSQEQLSGIVRSIINVEFAAMKSEFHQEIKDQVTTSALVKEDQIGSLKQQQDNLLDQMTKLGESLHDMERSVASEKTGSVAQRKEYEKQLSALKLNIGQLQEQLNKLQDDHHLLAGDVLGCCKDARLTLADVENHVSLLLGDIFGFSNSQGQTAETERDPIIYKSWNAGEISAWLRSYFVAKDDLETRLSSLVAAMQVQASEDASEGASAALQEAQQQTTVVIMNTVMEELREQLKLHQSMLDVQNEQATQKLNEQVKELVHAEMNLAKESLAKDLKNSIENQAAFSVEHIEHLVRVSVNEAVHTSVDEKTATVPDSILAILPALIADKVSESISSALPEQVNVAVEKKIENAVQEAVVATLPVMVSSRFEESMNEAVPEKIEEAVALAVPNAVTLAVAEAVSSAVNTTIAAAVAEAVAASKSIGCGTACTNGDEMAATTVNISHGNSNITLAGLAAHGLGAGLNESQVELIVKKALLKYDADRTGMVDHALEPAGGTIVSTRCTENYQVNQAEVRILGIPVYWYSNNNPRNIIQPDRMPGHCWAFKGSLGYVVISLAGPVRPTGFSLEHIPRSLSPSGSIDSAPREISVWGLENINDDGIKLGVYEYDQHGDPLQYFPVQKEDPDFYPLIELKINNNHGNQLYTCVYRFRVHGVRKK